MDLSGQVVVITGACGLLGREFSRAVTTQGGHAIITDINREAATRLADDLNQISDSSTAIPYFMDINDKNSIDNLILGLDREYGRIDALVNNAYPRNLNYGSDFQDVTYVDFCENLNLNLGGYFLASQIFSKYFLRQGHGNIINIASIYGVTSPKFEIYEGTEMTMPVEYALIKSGIIHFTRYMATYFRGKNIRVNSISPGGIRNKQPEAFLDKYDQHCLNKGMLDPHDISGTLTFLLSEKSAFINGQNIIVDDGFTL
jgi:NAD(P)-dependent dehydrogenase (short-subunit alcohol dehydrogenase family)